MLLFKTPRAVNGFTIVELLIVIVVIAILAAISVVAYNGIQSRANDSAVQSDVSNLAKKILLYEAENGQYPQGGRVRSGGSDNSASLDIFSGITMNIAKNSYLTSIHNLYYCTGTESATGVVSFRIYARSKSDTMYRYRSNGGLDTVTPFTLSSNTCLNEYNNAGAWINAYDTNAGWRAWASA